MRNARGIVFAIAFLTGGGGIAPAGAIELPTVVDWKACSDLWSNGMYPDECEPVWNQLFHIHTKKSGQADTKSATVDRKSGAYRNNAAASSPSQGVGATGAASGITGRYVYVALGGSDKIAAYAVDPVTGKQSNVPGAPFPAGRIPSAIAAHPSGAFLYATNAISDNISAYRISPGDGSLTPIGTFAAALLPESIAIHPSGRFAYVASVAMPLLQPYSIDLATGALLALGSALATGNFPTSIAVDRTGNFVYLVAGARIEGYRVGSNGTLTALPGSPFPAPSSIVSLAVSPTADLLFTANGTANSASSYAIDRTSGALTLVVGSPFAAGENPTWIATDPIGRYAVVANEGDIVGGADSTSVYVVDPSTGVLIPVAGSPFAFPGPGTNDIIVPMFVPKASYAKQNAAYQSRAFSGRGGSPPYTWTIAGGTPPPGISLNRETGALSGTPTTIGTFDFVVRITDANANQFDGAFFIAVTATGLPAGAVGAPDPYAVEYFHAGFGHYFTSTILDEVNKLDIGTLAGWKRTGQYFPVYPLGTADTGDVCRFFSTSFGTRSSHFYTPFASECATVKANPNWMFEGNVFGEKLPSLTGDCPAGTRALYRLYNNGKDGAPNHRYTTELAVRAATMAQGWIPEGYGPLAVIACVPA